MVVESWLPENRQTMTDSRRVALKREETLSTSTRADMDNPPRVAGALELDRPGVTFTVQCSVSDARHICKRSAALRGRVRFRHGEHAIVEAQVLPFEVRKNPCKCARIH